MGENTQSLTSLAGIEYSESLTSLDKTLNTVCPSGGVSDLLISKVYPK